ncbi:T9SS type A sorting domain-containing protein [bacterium]|nr:T9SS type A sorting domain-containing protein [bacterium]
MRMITFILLLSFLVPTVVPAFEEPHFAREDLLLEGREAYPRSLVKLFDDGYLRDWDNWRINSDSSGELQNEQQVAVNPTNPDNLVAVWRDFRLGYRRVGVGYTFDGGLNWTDTLLPDYHYTRHSDPGITYDSQGNFYTVILSYEDTNSPNGLFVTKSGDGGISWGPHVTAVDGVPGVFEDKELIACDRTGGLYDGNVYVSWARFYSTQIYNVRSTDGAQSFQTPIRISDSGGVQWPVPVVGADGTLVVAWVYTYGPAIRLDRSFDGGASFGSDIQLTSLYTGSTSLNGGITSYSFPAMDCDITDGPYDGRFYVAYMDRQGNDYDIYFRYSDNNAATWSSPLRINDDAVNNGRDQFHPWLTVSPDGAISVVFYDRRNDPSNYLMDLYFTQSLDGGATWSENRRVTTVSSDPNAGLRAGLIGEYIGLAASSANRVHPVWTDTREGNQDTYTSIIGNSTGLADAWSGNLSLTGIYPNPFRESTQINYSAASGASVSVRIYDVKGRLVRELSGHGGTLAWDGRDGSGNRLGNGVYLIQLHSGGEVHGGRTLLLR